MFNRDQLFIRPLSERKNKVEIESGHIKPGSPIGKLNADLAKQIEKAASEIRTARKEDLPVMLAFGAHTIKNGLSPVLMQLAEEGWISHMATNGAGIIHDWEFAFQGRSSEDVRANVAEGSFGLWQETGYYLNLAINIGSYRGLGYGESVGAMVARDGLEIPDQDELEKQICEKAGSWESAAASDLLSIIKHFDIPAGFMSIPHPFKKYGLQAHTYEHGIAFTSHPMFGHDIIYVHPMNHGASIGRCAERDFLSFAESVSNISGGIYLSIGSAVMSPMVFEKSMSMANNLALQNGKKMQDFSIYVVDLAPSTWDWNQGEPPQDDPAYYLRYCKTFSRMGGNMHYLQADNRDFLLALAEAL